MSDRVHVAIVVTRFEAGAGAVALRGAMGLDPDRFRISVIAGSGNRLLNEAVAAGFDVTVEPALRPEIALRSDWLALRRLESMLSARRVDVVHTHSAKAGVVGRCAARRAGIGRIIHTYHGFPFHEFQSVARRATYVRIERQLGTITDAGLCVGAAVAVEAVRRRLIEPQRIRTIGVSVSERLHPRTEAARTASRSALDLPPGAVVVGAVGRLSYQKAPEDFVAALEALDRRDVIGVWVGDGELAERVRRAADRAAPRARIIFLGDRADVPELLPAFDVFALPSRYEGVPVAIVEAMASGVPVVATAVNAVSDVVVPGETGLLVPPERPDLLAAAIGFLLDNTTVASQMAARALIHIADRHTDRTLARVLAEAYLPAARRGASAASCARSDLREPACS
ncbi:MAG: glycosyltransferase [Actinomycetota bacterium]|nr:glycosyltransferase [Actinomycetota bacterium]